MEVKVLCYTNPLELERQITRWSREFKYTLQGPVTVGINQNGNTIYVGTMVKDDEGGDK